MPKDNLSLSDETHCPPGTSFYTCDSNKFNGCCSEDPCALFACPDDLPSVRDPSDEDESSVGGEMATDSEERTTSSTRIMTDSGTTRTIPNNSRVTVTRHTVIVTDKMPSSTPSSTEVEATSSTTFESSTSFSTSVTEETSTPTPSETPTDSPTGTGTPLSTGAIVGVAVGGAIAIGILIVLVMAFRRHRRDEEKDDGSGVEGNTNWGEEKHLPQSMSAHTTGTQGSSDPFAPFGGRADQSEVPYQPEGNTFEMDASTAPVELPAISVEPSQRPPQPCPYRQEPIHKQPVQEAGPADPGANLNASAKDRQKGAYVNHWDQYRSLSQGN